MGLSGRRAEKQGAIQVEDDELGTARCDPARGVFEEADRVGQLHVFERWEQPALLRIRCH